MNRLRAARMGIVDALVNLHSDSQIQSAALCPKTSEVPEDQ